MLIGQGRSNPTVPGVSAPGFMAEVPKDLLSAARPQAWTWRTISVIADYVLAGQTGRTEWCVQIDSHGYAADVSSDGAALAIQLARSIDNILRGGFQGNLPDPDNTYVFGVYREHSAVDGYNDANRSYVRSQEYRIIYQQI